MLKIIAHRGASCEAVENTPAAFERARLAGAWGVELDVQCCGSGEVVVFHDRTLERLVGDPRRIDRLALSRLREVDLRGERICTLEEAFEAVGPDLEVNVELKIDGLRPTGLEVAVVRVLEDLRVCERTVISCFHPVALHRMRTLSPQIRRALLFGSKQGWGWRFGLQGLGARLWAVHPEACLATARRMAFHRRLGLATQVWTVDDPVEIRRIARDGADGVITNDPAAARAALAPELAL